MKTISLVSFKRRLWLMLGMFLTFCVLMVAAAAVYAAPQSLMRHVASFPVVFDQKCNVPSLGIRQMECIITFDQVNNAVYVVLFNDNLDVVRVIVNHNGKEHELWCHPTVCS